MSNKKHDAYIKEISDRLVEQIKNNNAPWQKPWKAGDVSKIVPVNSNGVEYKGANFINLLSKAAQEGYADNRWFTFNGANAVGGKIKKDEKGTSIHYWKRFNEVAKTDENGNKVLDDNGKVVTEKLKLARPRVYFATVFNADQIENLPEREVKPVNEMQEWQRHARCENIIANSEANIIHKPSNRAYYSPSKDHIVMPERSQFESADLYYATLLHELGHQSGHPSRLNRDLTGEFGSASYAKEELRAEIASMLIGQELQIGHDPSQHLAYLKHWAEIVEDDPKAIFDAVKDADAISKYVLAFEDAKDYTIESDPSITDKIENDHVLTKSNNENYTTAKETWDIIQSHADTFGFKPVISDIPLDEMSFKKYLIEYYKDDQKTSITTELSAGDGKAVTSFDGERIDGTFYTSDAAWIRQSLDRAFDNELKTTTYVSELPKTVQSVFEEMKSNHPNATIERLSQVSASEKLSFRASITDDVSAVIKSDGNVYVFNKENLVGNGSKDYELIDKNIIEAIGGDVDRTESIRTYLHVPYEQKDEAKELGAKWDKDNSMWYAPAGSDLEPFNKWLNKPEPKPTIKLTPEEEFTKFLESYGCEIKGGHPKFDGEFHRIHIEGDKSGSNNGSYVVYTDNGIPRGYFKNFKSGEEEKWVYSQPDYDNSRPMVDFEKAKAEADAKRKSGYDNTAVIASEIYNSGVEANPNHQYLVNKQVNGSGVIKAVGGNDTLPISLADKVVIGNDWRESKSLRENPSNDKIVLTKGDLLVAGSNEKGEIRTIQTISENGYKSYLKGSEKKGTYLQVGEIENGKPFLITEGVSTGLTLHEQSKIGVVIAFDKSNLAEVGDKMRLLNPDSKIYFAADNDHEQAAKYVAEGRTGANGELNAGVEGAEKAAARVGGYVLVPQFEANEKGSDWNDLYVNKGIDEFRQQMRHQVLTSQKVDNFVDSPEKKVRL